MMTCLYRRQEVNRWYNAEPKPAEEAPVSYTLPLGPFHPILHGPQKFLFRIEDERIVDVEYQNGLNERGCAERMTRLDLPSALFLAGRVCGECSFAHTLAFCAAIEQLCGIEVPRRAQQIRVATAELERTIAHLRGTAQILETLGMADDTRRLKSIRATAVDLFAGIGGARVATDLCLPGGLSRDLAGDTREALLIGLASLGRALFRTIDRLIEHRLLLMRTLEIGMLPRAAAEQLGVRGPLARATGIPRDTRVDTPYLVYHALGFTPVIQEGGDLYARLMVLLLEAYESIKLSERALHELTDGDWHGRFPADLAAGSSSGAVEGPRGKIRYSLESDGSRLTGVRIDTPRQFDRLLVRTLFSRALIDNAAAIAASAYACVACAEC